MKSFAVCLSILFVFAIRSDAWLRPYFEDEIIVQRSELIVVAHLKANSIQFISNENTQSHENHATLVITETIKGKSDTNEIPIIIHYGLDPIVGGYVNHDGFIMNARENRKDYPTNLVPIIDTGGKGLVVEDASKDNIWFLRRLGGYLGREPSETNNLGILAPEDVQSLKLKKYFEAYLSVNPENAIQSYVTDHPEVTGRAQRYFKHLEVQQILKINDPTARFDALLPHYLDNESWDMKPDIRNGIISCGSVAGEKLVPIFNDPAHADFRDNIILIWRGMDYTNVAPMLIELLKDYDKFWAKQTLTNNWWNTDVGSALTKERRTNYGEVYYSVAALGTFHYLEAKESIELTKKRWEAIHFDNPQIVEACDAALKEFANQK